MNAFSRPTPEQVASARILKKMAEGKSLEEAFDAVLGPGTFKGLAGDVWKILRGEI